MGGVVVLVRVYHGHIVVRYEYSVTTVSVSRRLLCAQVQSMNIDMLLCAMGYRMVCGMWYHALVG